MNIVGLIKSLTSLNQNCRFDRVKSPEESYAFSGEAWAKKNAEVGGKTANWLKASFGLGIIRNYFNSFFNLEESPVLGLLVRAITGAGDFLEGKRDEEMFSIYGHGVDELSGKSPEEIITDDAMLSHLDKKKEDYFIDDAMQNIRQEALYGERLISKFAKWSTQAANIKPVAHFVSGVLGNSWKTGIQTLLDLPARIYWRIRFFGKSLHSNFVTSIWDLTRFKFLSLLGSSSASKNYEDKIKELGNLSGEYFKDKNIGNPGLGLYVRMLKDRMAEHWNAIWNPKAALEKKYNDKFLQLTTEQKRAADPSQRFENGFVDPNSNYDQKEQSRLALADFTGPICAALGLIGTVVFDPLKIIWGITGFERGKKLITALSASRKTFSLIHYIPRFLIPELNESKKYKDLEKKYMNSDKDPNKAVSELYYASKSRYHNALIGMAMAAGNICEPLLHLMRGITGDSKFGNFVIDSFVRFNDTFFLLFSKRREVQGRLERVRVMAQEIARSKGRTFVTNEDYENISDDEFDRAMKDKTVLSSGSQQPSLIRKGLDLVATTVNKIESACTGEAYSKAQAA
ncbi:MAG: hypothetical protein A3F80_04370 [Candidatus Melainabacteria bacterium RIFCSPLOWO2_12_FULL_35_11]|nr:MAG: hypothetical protein A3F80_04370 [Candidatus Melainabacteria bacterium RIFCSPLOWO2_12_FULL_35_11]